MNYELVVFDWDGTLMDSAGAIVACMQAAACDLGLPPPDDRTARQVIGLGLHDALAQAMPGVPQGDYALVADRYRRFYLAQDHRLGLFPGAQDLIAGLAADGRLLGVATGKSRPGLNRALDMSGMRPLFHATRCADECCSKPHPEMLLELMDELGVEAARTLMVGDTTHDLLMARNAGVAAVAVSFGAHTRDVLEAAAPLTVCDSVGALGEWLRHQG